MLLQENETEIPSSITNENKINYASENNENIEPLYSAMKTIMVLGQILKNYPGYIDGERKIEIIRTMHELGMRIVGDLLDVVDGYTTSLIDYLIRVVRNEGDIFTSFEISNEVKKLFGGMLAQAAMLMIRIIAISFVDMYSINAAEKAIGCTVSGRLVLFDIKMNCLAKPNFKELEISYNEFKEKHLDFAEITLKYITHEYLRYNKCGTSQRDHLCSIMGFRKQNLLLDSKK